MKTTVLFIHFIIAMTFAMSYPMWPWWVGVGGIVLNTLVAFCITLPRINKYRN